MTIARHRGPHYRALAHSSLRTEDLQLEASLDHIRPSKPNKKGEEKILGEEEVEEEEQGQEQEEEDW